MKNSKQRIEGYNHHKMDRTDEGQPEMSNSFKQNVYEYKSN